MPAPVVDDVLASIDEQSRAAAVDVEREPDVAVPEFDGEEAGTARLLSTEENQTLRRRRFYLKYGTVCL